MARFKRIDVMNKIGETGIIPIFYHNDPVICRNAVKACYEGGIRVFEFTNRSDFAHEVFSDLCKWVENELPDLILCAGSVVDAGAVCVGMGSNRITREIVKKKDWKEFTKRTSLAVKTARKFIKY